MKTYLQDGILFAVRNLVNAPSPAPKMRTTRDDPNFQKYLALRDAPKESAAQVPATATSGAEAMSGTTPDAADQSEDAPWVHVETSAGLPVSPDTVIYFTQFCSDEICGPCAAGDLIWGCTINKYRLAHPTPRTGELLPREHPRYEKQRLYMSDDTLKCWVKDPEEVKWRPLKMPSFTDKYFQYHIAHKEAAQ